MSILKKINYFLLIYKSKLFNKENRTILMDYQEYLNLQKKKTTDPERISKWKNEEWEVKKNGFKKMFHKNIKLLSNKKNALCLGSRTGQEVLALKEMNINAIGVDLVAFPPYTVEGDVHNLHFSDNSFDLIFSNIFDHVLYPEKFIQESFRVLDFGGIFILHIQLGFDPDEFSVNFLYNETKVKLDFIANGFKIIKEGVIVNDFDSMNYEFIFIK